MLYQRWGSFVRGQFRLLWEVRPPDGVPVGQRRRHVGSQLAYAEDCSSGVFGADDERAEVFNVAASDCVLLCALAYICASWFCNLEKFLNAWCS